MIMKSDNDNVDIFGVDSEINENEISENPDWIKCWNYWCYCWLFCNIQNSIQYSNSYFDLNDGDSIGKEKR